mgnify:CR=1 FL=1
MWHLNFIKKSKKETQNTNNLSTTIYYVQVRMEFDMSYLFFKNINQEEFDEFVKHHEYCNLLLKSERS